VLVGTLCRATSGSLVLPRVWLARSAWERMRGLLGRPPLAADEGMLITRCGSVHTFGMRYALDLAFIDRDDRICKLVSALHPGRMAGSRSAVSTLELAVGTLAATGLKAGDHVTWKEIRQ
jgi:uncharacterized membrane protein (UPF0127 family)